VQHELRDRQLMVNQPTIYTVKVGLPLEYAWKLLICRTTPIRIGWIKVGFCSGCTSKVAGGYDGCYWMVTPKTHLRSRIISYT